MNNTRTWYSCMLVSVLFLLLPLSTRAGMEDLDLPYSGKNWINGGPYAQEALQNKTVVFYFYEED